MTTWTFPWGSLRFNLGWGQKFTMGSIQLKRRWGQSPSAWLRVKIFGGCGLGWMQEKREKGEGRRVRAGGFYKRGNESSGRGFSEDSGRTTEVFMKSIGSVISKINLDDRDKYLSREFQKFGIY